MNMYLKKFVKENFSRPGKALDLGCGEGFDVACLRHLDWDADGVDKQECDLNKLYKGIKRYDLVYSNYVLPFITNERVFVKNFIHNLKAGGRIFLATFSNEDLVFVRNGKAKEDLIKLFEDFPSVKNVRVEEHDAYDNNEGHKHWHKVLVLTAEKKQK